MAIVIKNEWPEYATLSLQCSGVEHNFKAKGDIWRIEGEELRRVLDSDGWLCFGEYNEEPVSVLRVEDNLEYVLELSRGIAPSDD